MAWTEITRRHYRRDALRCASDLTNAEWALISPFMPIASKVGRPRKTNLRSVVEAILFRPRPAASGARSPRSFLPMRRCKAILRLVTQGIAGAHQPHTGHGPARDGRARGKPDGGHHRQPVGEDHRERRPHRLRCGQEDQRPQASHRHRYRGPSGRLTGHFVDIQDRDGAPGLLASMRSLYPWLRHIFADGGYAAAGAAGSPRTSKQPPKAPWAWILIAHIRRLTRRLARP
jgi:hypothetical protein